MSPAPRRQRMGGQQDKAAADQRLHQVVDVAEPAERPIADQVAGLKFRGWFLLWIRRATQVQARAKERRREG